MIIVLGSLGSTVKAFVSTPHIVGDIYTFDLDNSDDKEFLMSNLEMSVFSNLTVAKDKFVSVDVNLLSLKDFSNDKPAKGVSIEKIPYNPRAVLSNILLDLASKDNVEIFTGERKVPLFELCLNDLEFMCDNLSLVRITTSELLESHYDVVNGEVNTYKIQLDYDPRLYKIPIEYIDKVLIQTVGYWLHCVKVSTPSEFKLPNLFTDIDYIVSVKSLQKNIKIPVLQEQDLDELYSREVFNLSLVAWISMYTINESLDVIKKMVCRDLKYKSMVDGVVFDVKEFNNL